MLAIQTANLLNHSPQSGAGFSTTPSPDSATAPPQLDAPLKKTLAADHAGADKQFLHRQVNISELAKSLFSEEKARTENSGDTAEVESTIAREVVKKPAVDAPAQQDNADDFAQKNAEGKKVSQSENLKKELVEQAEIKQLKERDREVRAHEQAHAAVGGAIAGSPSFGYSKGPDGVLYAVSGEVSISTSSVAGDPQATLQKSQKIIAAANAPAQPSAQDRAVAAQAAQMANQARVEIVELRQESLKLSSENGREKNTEKEHEEFSNKTSPPRSGGSGLSRSVEGGVSKGETVKEKNPIEKSNIGANISNIKNENRNKSYIDVERIGGGESSKVGQTAEAIVGALINASA